MRYNEFDLLVQYCAGEKWPFRGQPIENKEGIEPCPGVSFSYPRLLRLELKRMIPILMTASCMLNALRDMCLKVQMIGFSVRICRHPTQNAGKKAGIPYFL
jgi:hypothetical protein